MEIQRCFELLELSHDVSLDEAEQAYKDMVVVWHPDRFSHNPRLRQKAEQRLKEVNVAYETVKLFLSSKQEQAPGEKESRGARPNAQAEAEVRDKTEIAFEASTRIILSVCSYLYTAIRSLVVSEAPLAGTEAKDEAKPRNPNH